MKLSRKKEEKKTEQEKVDQRREEVLAAGRKFKYPLQWTKHRVVINTILISFVVLGILVTAGWLALYRFNMTDDMLYRLTKIIPVPVATVDGNNVRFSDYLMLYRSSITSINRQSDQNLDGSVDSIRPQYMRIALTESEQFTYAEKLAKELGITVSQEEVDAEFKRHQNIGGIERSEDGFMKIIEENFGLSRSEYKHMLYLSLIKAKVEIEIDESASSIANRVETLLAENSGNYTAVADALGEEIVYEETGGMVSSQNIDGGRATEALKLEPGQQSGRFVSINGDGYYFVKLVAKTETEVNFVSIKVPFNEFEKRFAALREENKISEFITIPAEDESVEDGS
ncbi:MAG: SurA N-terminal domain-containing protein [Candidatus Saccharibacteria bacterium]|nr:SurA N-terminal domain-containing protein [Candidatus Saccharibacteria bacterium]